MQIKFTVHTAGASTENVTAEVNGQQLRAAIDAFEVELISDHYGALKLRFIGAAVEEAKEKFKVDSVHVWSV